MPRIRYVRSTEVRRSHSFIVFAIRKALHALPSYFSLKKTCYIPYQKAKKYTLRCSAKRSISCDPKLLFAISYANQVTSRRRVWRGKKSCSVSAGLRPPLLLATGSCRSRTSDAKAPTARTAPACSTTSVSSKAARWWAPASTASSSGPAATSPTASRWPAQPLRPKRPH